MVLLGAYDYHATLNVCFVRGDEMVGDSMQAIACLCSQIIPWVLLGLVTVVHAEEKFLPPKNTITTDVVAIAGGFTSLKIGEIEEARARTIGIPLRNLGDAEMKLETVSVNDEWMIVQTNDLVIAPNKTASLYLSVTPLELGKFLEEVHIRFENGPTVVAVVKSFVKPSFKVYPGNFGLVPGDKKGMENTITSNFGVSHFTVTSSPDPFVEVKTIHRDKSSVTILCTMKEKANGVRPPRESRVPIQVHSGKRTYEYRLYVLNTRAIECNPASQTAGQRFDPVTRRLRLAATVLLSGNDIINRLISCQIEERGTGLELELDPQNVGRRGGTYQILINGDPRDRESIHINWIEKGSKEILATTEIKFRPRQ